MKQCPICEDVLVFNEATMSGFSWHNPSVSCEGCNFKYCEKVDDHMYGGKGKSGFEIGMMAKDSAESRLVRLFDIKVREEVVKTRRIYE